jgi:hypothetical protein
MSPAREHLQKPTRRVPTFGFSDGATAQRYHRIGSEDEGIALLRGHSLCFLRSEPLGKPGRHLAAPGSFIDIGRHHVSRHNADLG